MFRALRHVSHSLAHRHSLLSKEGVGEFSICVFRLAPWRCRVSFRPDLDGAGWHGIPSQGDTELIERMALAGSPLGAMAVLRAAGEAAA